MSDTDEDLQLSDVAAAALQEFLREKAEQEDIFRALQEREEAEFDISLFTEDWQLSQFWYSDETALELATEATCQAKCRVGFISSPSAFLAMKREGLDKQQDIEATLYEFDERFKVIKEFCFYDYKDPLALDLSLKGAYDVLVCDPPFLSVECLNSVANTIKFLGSSEVRIIFCTGLVMRAELDQQLKCHMTTFYPTHKNGLSNDFRCYVNYDSESFAAYSDLPPPPSR